MSTNNVCQECGSGMPGDAPAGLCPRCLLKSEAPTMISEAGDEGPIIVARGRPRTGEVFGHYKILRLLGQGGMGEVYEAEEMETSRRVALKVMNHALQSEGDRKRFLREGRLAASVNHPNVVYVHGSEEIENVPVISMELVHGGTLKDRLKREGTLQVSEAVEATLEMISGLEKAERAGVLHRDIKPANCFVDADGHVKIGDFGLSVSTIARGESMLTASGAVMGTPAYASPEQLRGEDLDVRSDIYSLGATLYHLLTGRTPFAATDFVKLITEVLDKEAAAPHTIRADLPVQLSKIVARCLAKDRKGRFQTYGELREALLPYRATELEPALPGRRFLAGVIDDLIAYGPILLGLMYSSFEAFDLFARERTWSTGAVFAALYGWYVLYYTVTEGLWGGGLGKTLCGLRVVDETRQCPGIPRALLRAAVYFAPAIIPPLVTLALYSPADVRAMHARGEMLPSDSLWLPLYLALFVTMRRRNGFAALQDLLSRTRVVMKARAEARPTLNHSGASFTATGPLTPAGGTGEFRPYEIRGTVWSAGGQALLSAHDPSLQRNVWIHVTPAGPAPREETGRRGRLRWLHSRESEGKRWTAYEAPGGAPLANLTGGVPWSTVRYWLADLAEELHAALRKHEAHLEIALDRIWIANDGHAVLLDFPANGLPAGTRERTLNSDEDALAFLVEVARFCRTAEAAALPVPAKSLLEKLGTFEKLEYVIGNLQSLLQKPAAVTRRWRFASIAGVAFTVTAFGLLAAFGVVFGRMKWEQHWADKYPDKPSLRVAQQMYVDVVDEQSRGEARLEDVRLAAIYLREHFSDVITNQAFWNEPDFAAVFPESSRRLLAEALEFHAPASAEKISEANRVVPRWMNKAKYADRIAPFGALFACMAGGYSILALVALAGAAGFRRDPLLHLFGIAIVDRAGEIATRGRLVVRWIVLWIPLGVVGAISLFCYLVALGGSPEMLNVTSREYPLLRAVMWTGAIVTSVAIAIPVVIAVLNPNRSLVDRVSGTELVPR